MENAGVGGGGYLEGGAHPEGVAGVDGLVGPPVEAVLLAHDAPAAYPVQLLLREHLLQLSHQAQRGHGAEGGAPWGRETLALLTRPVSPSAAIRPRPAPRHRSATEEGAAVERTCRKAFASPTKAELTRGASGSLSSLPFHLIFIISPKKKKQSAPFAWRAKWGSYNLIYTFFRWE